MKKLVQAHTKMYRLPTVVLALDLPIEMQMSSLEYVTYVRFFASQSF